ncbi:MAG: undecaprenyldiphospho-muramoylpentapeptide beta-N-acetylglucosaminyltransferase [Syntrophomonadaceae bacterium]|nr:undecaprenyldiphospho-muramoylpentapeptide beta-N-acetylglucosaminyltransferase [Syntrophomonadaceae bacterium]
MKVIIACGGTGGHIYPALAIARGLVARIPGVEVLFVGTAHGMERTIIPQHGFAFTAIEAQGLDRSSLRKKMRALSRLPVGFWQARQVLRSFPARLVVGTGGYASYPMVLAAQMLGVPTVIHEQNAIPGLANRLLARRAERVLLTFSEAAEFLPGARVEVTGLPVRPEIVAMSRSEARQRLELDAELFTVLVFGGSRGARSINCAVQAMVEAHRGEGMQVVWVTGEAWQQQAPELSPQAREAWGRRLRVIAYQHHMAEALAAADLAVCRAGAATLAELAIVGLPAILVPYPYAADAHQERNARALEARGAVEVIVDEFLDGEVLWKHISALSEHRERLRAMAEAMRSTARPDALERIVDVLAAYLV